jgi:hypothetical protein
LCQAIIASTFIPAFSGIYPARWRNTPVIDGGFSVNQVMCEKRENAKTQKRENAKTRKCKNAKTRKRKNVKNMKNAKHVKNAKMQNRKIAKLNV